MVTQCPKCRSACSQGSRFCEQCGSALSGPLSLGRTQVMPTGPTPPPNTPASQVYEPPLPPPVDGPYRPGDEQVFRIQVVGGPPETQREHSVLVTDRSGSMGEIYDGGMTKLQAAIRADLALIVEKTQLDPHDEVGIVVFNHQAEVIHNLVPLHSHRASLIKAVQSISPDGGTDIRAGLEEAASLFDWSCDGVVRRIVLLTDGHGGHPLSVAQDLKTKGVVIDVIGVGPNPREVDERLLKKVASVVQGELRYRFITDSRTLCRTYQTLAGKTHVSAAAEMMQ